MLFTASSLVGMEWENSVVIASFSNSRQCERDAQRLVDILKAHKIAAVITKSDPSVISVYTQDESKARDITSSAIKRHRLRITTVHEHSTVGHPRPNRSLQPTTGRSHE
jgi:hypothetical protein